MVNPEYVDSIAQRAYEFFRTKYPQSVEWSQVTELARIRWRDDVIEGEKVRNKVTTIFQEQCVFDALAEYHAGETPALQPPLAEKLPLDETNQASAEVDPPVEQQLKNEEEVNHADN